MELLEVKRLSVTYGVVRAVDGLTLRVPKGKLIGLIGPNGAGKTTAIDAISGFVPSLGDVFLDDQNISKFRVYQRVRAGLARTWQSSELFDDLTVVENLRVATECGSSVDPVSKSLFKRRQNVTADLDAAVELLGLEGMLDKMPSELSHGQRKLVGVARALSGRPRVLMLDEPAAGLDSTESVELGAQLRRMVDGGITILLVDHDMGLVLNVCDYIYVLEFGCLIAEGTPAQIRADDSVIAAYLGGQEGSGGGKDSPSATVSGVQS